MLWSRDTEEEKENKKKKKMYQKNKADEYQKRPKQY